jgi:hypothetical protein
MGASSNHLHPRVGTPTYASVHHSGAACWNDYHMSTVADNAMLVVRAFTRAKKDGLSFYELQQATRLAAEYLPGILHMLEQQGWVVSALVDGIGPPKRLWHLRKQAKETFGL